MFPNNYHKYTFPVLSIIPVVLGSLSVAQDSVLAAGGVVTPEQIMKELGPDTGLLSGDQNYDGKTISGVFIRYAGKNQTVDRGRLLDMLATKRGGKYSSDQVNRDWNVW